MSIVKQLLVSLSYHPNRRVFDDGTPNSYQHHQPKAKLILMLRKVLMNAKKPYGSGA